MNHRWIFAHLCANSTAAEKCSNKRLAFHIFCNGCRIRYGGYDMQRPMVTAKDETKRLKPVEL